MAAVDAYGSLNEIKARAVSLRLTPVFLAILAWPFVALGAIVRVGLVPLKFAIAAVQVGYQQADEAMARKTSEARGG